MKYIITEHQRERTIKRLLSYHLEPHEEKTSDKRPNSIFWVKKGKVIVEIKNSEDFWIDHSIWDEISDTFSLEFEEQQRIIKEWLEEHYGLGGLTPYYLFGIKYTKLEEHYGLGGLTPYNGYKESLIGWRSIRK